MKRIIVYMMCTGLLAFFFKVAHPQNETNTWLYGLGNHLDFSTGKPVIIDPSPLNIDAHNGISVVSDKNGKVLMYRDSWYTYNQFGSKIYSSPYNNYYNEGQGVVGFMKPGQDSLIYFFAISNPDVPYCCGYQKFRSVTYWVMNRKLNNNLGGVHREWEQLIPYDDSVCSKLTAVLHCNKKDVWVVGHYKNSANYFAFLVTDSGVSAPVISTCNMYNDTQGDPAAWKNNHQGNLKFSPDGKKLVAVFQGEGNFAELSDFNAPP
jgi:hypothetical protein